MELWVVPLLLAMEWAISTSRSPRWNEELCSECSASWTKAQEGQDDPRSSRTVAGKLEGMANRRYLEVGHVSSSLDFFAVPKGDSDIRVVFDGSSCGLNLALWASNFFLPPLASSAVMLLSFNTWMADMDFGEMFHNFPMED